MPSNLGIIMSSITMSTTCLFKYLSASSPSHTTFTTLKSSWLFMYSERISVKSSLSSAKRTFIFFICHPPCHPRHMRQFLPCLWIQSNSWRDLQKLQNSYFRQEDVKSQELFHPLSRI